MTLEEVIKRCDENTIGVVPTLGVTFTGSTSRCKPWRRPWTSTKRRPGSTSPCTWTAPVAAFSLRFALRISFGTFASRASNRSMRPATKFGLSPFGVGWVVWRDEKDLPDELVFWVNYLVATCATSG